MIDRAWVSESVIHVFDAAGIKKPDVSILSEDFLVELKSYHYKKEALEALKKLFNDELTALAKVKRVATGRKNRQSVGRLIVILLQM